MNTKTLDITFDTTQQKPIRLSLPKINQALTKELVAAQADKILKLNILSPPGMQVTQVKTAQVTDKTTTILF
ncbi:MAG: DUF2922 domain-containing protein [Staphylococcus rostri]|uniref:DUF2922 domain-containing protein n=1 Tax=Staphylococcus rostri TaxID=522262 RepID=UPI0026E01725|nr:DUF2922 domain-containing protein [Staphylococcus rostri]MDO5375122.1 DUF2922 domain-containing protein [Staphylococcus rostri]